MVLFIKLLCVYYSINQPSAVFQSQSQDPASDATPCGENPKMDQEQR